MKLRKATLVLSAGGVLAGGALAGWMSPALFQSAQALAEPAPAQSAAGNIPLGAAPNYAAIVRQNRAAVVGITVSGMRNVAAQGDEDDNGASAGGGQDNPFGDDPFFKFFRGLPGVPRTQPHATPMHGLGSGFIVRSDGIILTNAHVVRDAQHVTVTLSDHHEYRAKVLGVDTSTDVAVLKINAQNLPTVHLGEARQIEVGDYVLAIGQPYGLEETATAGIVSAMGRSLGNSSVPFIQTDVAVNPGNSGGPLFDAHGSVVGINSQIYSNTGGFEGVSFAIPIDVAVRDEQQILKTGKVQHARLGVVIQGVNQALATSFKLPAPAGALVSKVEPDSAAARAGLKSGDVILKFNGQSVTDAGSLSAAVSMTDPGQSATLDVWRDGRPMTVKATLANASDTEGRLEKTSATEHGKLGLSVRPLTSDERSQANVPGGLLVERVAGPAAEAGIQPGDVVLSADGKTVSSVEQLVGVVSGHKDAVALLIQRGDQRIFIPVQLG
jgi:serine protease Do